MNTERIKQLAEQAGISLSQKDYSYYWVESAEDIEKFAALVAAEEREECLKICLDYNRFYWMATHGGLKCAELIKERNDECLTAPLTKTRRNGESSRLGQNRKNG